MTIYNLLKNAQSRLEAVSVPTARLDALVLMEDISGQDRSWLLAHPNAELSGSQLVKLDNLLSRRLKHEPLAYIRSKTEFYGREFLITHGVLEPRPESETMIDMLKELPNLPSTPAISDVGCGSGCLGITAALELPSSHTELLDIDAQALKIAKINVDKFTPGLYVSKSDLLERSRLISDILLCNLPYVPDDFHINLAATHEPPKAIYGGSDGLKLYRKLFKQVEILSKKPLYILTEALPMQHPDLSGIARAAGYELLKTDDFIQAFRLKIL